MLIPVAMCIAVNETGELTAAVTGAVCGLLIDFTFGKVFGFSAVLLLFICMLTALLFKHWFRNTAFNIALICGGFTLIYVCLDFLFYYGIWGYENSLFVFLHYELPACLYTVIFAVIIHPLFKWIGLRRGSSPPARKKTPKR
jgi:rod shape-determining protein MreD